MSVEAVTWALKQVTEQPVDKLILISLANFADENHSAFPGRKKLAEVGMCSLDTVDRANKRLEARGLIRKDRRLSARGGASSNCYILAVDGLAADCGQHDEPDEVAAGVPVGQPQIAARVAASECGEGSRIGCGHKEIPKEIPKEDAPQPPLAGGQSELPPNVVEVKDWSQAMRPPDEHAEVVLQNDRIVLKGETYREWLVEFGNDDKRLRLALTAARGSIRPNSRTHTLEVQVFRCLANEAAKVHDQNSRYQAAVEAGRSSSSKPIQGFRQAQAERAKALLLPVSDDKRAQA